jgi:hypothetical protein
MSRDFKGTNFPNGIEVPNSGLTISGTAVVASAAELNILDGATVTTAELNKLDGSGAVVASGTQAAVIADPTGGTTTDAEARTAINAIIDALQAFGIVATE